MSRRSSKEVEWVIHLPPAPGCSVDSFGNLSVRQDGSTFESPATPSEDRCYTCHFQDRVQLCMVLDGHDGTKAVNFARTRIPHHLLKRDLSGRGGQVRDAVRSAIVKTESEFFLGIDGHLTRLLTLQMEIGRGEIDSATASRLFPAQMAEIGRLGEAIKGGTTVVAALIHENKLYIANVGNSRALLCSQSRDGTVTRVEQVSVDHDTNNEDELRRLAGCGLDSNKLWRCGRLGAQQNTRSIGDYYIKGGYKNDDLLSHATHEPGTAEPYLHGPVDLSAFHGFLILMSNGLCEAYKSCTGRPDRINEDIANLVASNLRSAPNLNAVAQKVVEKVKNMYCEECKQDCRSGRLDDMTLVIKSLVSAAQPHQLPADDNSPTIESFVVFSDNFPINLPWSEINAAVVTFSNHFPRNLSWRDISYYV